MKNYLEYFEIFKKKLIFEKKMKHSKKPNNLFPILSSSQNIYIPNDTCIFPP